MIARRCDLNGEMRQPQAQRVSFNNRHGTLAKPQSLWMAAGPATWSDAESLTGS